MEPQRLVMSVEEAAELLDIGRSTAYEAIRRGQIPSVRIGRRILIPWVGVERLLAVPNRPDSMTRQ